MSALNKYKFWFEVSCCSDNLGDKKSSTLIGLIFDSYDGLSLNNDIIWLIVYFLNF